MGLLANILKEQPVQKPFRPYVRAAPPATEPLALRRQAPTYEPDELRVYLRATEFSNVSLKVQEQSPVPPVLEERRQSHVLAGIYASDAILERIAGFYVDYFWESTAGSTFFGSKATEGQLAARAKIVPLLSASRRLKTITVKSLYRHIVFRKAEQYIAFLQDPDIESYQCIRSLTFKTSITTFSGGTAQTEEEALQRRLHEYTRNKMAIGIDLQKEPAIPLGVIIRGVGPSARVAGAMCKLFKASKLELEDGASLEEFKVTVPGDTSSSRDIPLVVIRCKSFDISWSHNFAGEFKPTPKVLEIINSRTLALFEEGFKNHPMLIAKELRNVFEELCKDPPGPGVEVPPIRFRFSELPHIFCEQSPWVEDPADRFVLVRCNRACGVRKNDLHMRLETIMRKNRERLLTAWDTGSTDCFVLP